MKQKQAIMIKRCKGASFTAYNQLTCFQKKYTSKRLFKEGDKVSCGNLIEASSSLSLCEGLKQPFMCPLNDMGYNALPEIEKDDVFQEIKRGIEK